MNDCGRSRFISDFGNHFKTAINEAQVRCVGDCFANNALAVLADDFKKFMEVFLTEFN